MLGVNKFIYLWETLTIQSYHKPLPFLLHGNKGIPQHASGRLQHWALTLSTQFHTRSNNYYQMLMLCQLRVSITTAEIPTPTEWEFLVNCLSGTCTTASFVTSQAFRS